MASCIIFSSRLNGLSIMTERTKIVVRLCIVLCRVVVFISFWNAKQTQYIPEHPQPSWKMKTTLYYYILFILNELVFLEQHDLYDEFAQKCVELYDKFTRVKNRMLIPENEMKELTDMFRVELAHFEHKNAKKWKNYWTRRCMRTMNIQPDEKTLKDLRTMNNPYQQGHALFDCLAMLQSYIYQENIYLEILKAVSMYIFKDIMSESSVYFQTCKLYDMLESMNFFVSCECIHVISSTNLEFYNLADPDEVELIERISILFENMPDDDQKKLRKFIVAILLNLGDTTIVNDLKRLNALYKTYDICDKEVRANNTDQKKNVYTKLIFIY